MHANLPSSLRADLRLDDETEAAQRPNLHALSPLYDLTPPSSITAVVTEMGIIPPNSLAWIPLSQAEQ